VVIGDDLAAITPMEIALSTEIFGVFMAMFLFCISGAEDKELAALREIVRETYPSDS
jgi:hypothetical protein